MKKVIPILLVFFFCITLSHAQRVAESSQTELVVQFVDGINGTQFLKEQKFDSQYGLRVKKDLAPRFGFYLLEIRDAEKMEVAIESLRSSTKVISAQANLTLDFRNTIPNDPFWAQQWGMERINAPAVWDVTTGGLTANGDEIVVAVIDRGFDVEHPDWQGNIWENPKELNGNPGFDDDGDGLTDNIYGYNFFNDSQFLWGVDHGTWVTGVVGSKGNNNIGVTGVNWDVKMMFLRIENVADVVRAFNFVIEERERYNASNGEEGSFIVATNGSFGVDGQFCDVFPSWGTLYDPLGEAGVLSVAATANEDWSVEEVGDMPGTCTSEYLITVTAINQEDEKVSNASYGEVSIDLGAPTYVPSTEVGGDIRESFSGTSAACPHVAGAVALLYSLPCTELADMATSNPASAARLMKKAILENVDPIPDLNGITVTEGILDVYESMKYLHAYCISRISDREEGDFKPKYIEEKSFVYLSPNPVSDELNIIYGNDGFGEITVRIFNSIGQEMDVQLPAINKPFEEQNIKIDVRDWSAGTYTVSIMGAEKESTIKFVKI